MTIVFEDDDAAYQAWLSSNPHGYVINTPKSRPASNMVIHRSRCWSISQYTAMCREGGFTERDYIKICSESVADLRDWVRQNGRLDGSFSKECGHCKPVGRPT